MRKKIICAFTLLAVLMSCQERNPDLFLDLSGVYFNNVSGSLTAADSLDLTFVYESSDELIVPVRIQLVGRSTPEDRPLNISVTSDNAAEGVDYILPESPVMPADASEAIYELVLKRTDALKVERKMIELRIQENECFDLPVTELIQGPDTISTVSLRIYFSDMFTKAPSAWDENLVGEFSQQKFVLICRVLEIDPADFNDPGIITLAKLLFISSEMTDYVSKQVEMRNAGLDYDKDAFDALTDEPLTFR